VDVMTVMDLGRDAMLTALLLCAPVLGVSLLAGLLISVFQAATQIQEMTLTFVPKLVACAIAIAVFGPWMAQIMLKFTRETWDLMNVIGR
jgi:flagellar biosynthesis protein FliQ